MNTNLVKGFAITFIQAEGHLSHQVLNAFHRWGVKFKLVLNITIVGLWWKN